MSSCVIINVVTFSLTIKRSPNKRLKQNSVLVITSRSIEDTANNSKDKYEISKAFILQYILNKNSVCQQQNLKCFLSSLFNLNNKLTRAFKKIHFIGMADVIKYSNPKWFVKNSLLSFLCVLRVSVVYLKKFFMFGLGSL